MTPPTYTGVCEFHFYLPPHPPHSNYTSSPFAPPSLRPSPSPLTPRCGRVGTCSPACGVFEFCSHRPQARVRRRLHGHSRRIVAPTTLPTSTQRIKHPRHRRALPNDGNKVLVRGGRSRSRAGSPTSSSMCAVGFVEYQLISDAFLGDFRRVPIPRKYPF